MKSPLVLVIVIEMRSAWLLPFCFVLTGCNDKKYEANFSHARLTLAKAESAAEFQTKVNVIYWKPEQRAPLIPNRSNEDYEAREEIAKAMDKIRKPPQSYAQAYRDLTKAYGAYISIYNLA